MNNQASSYLEPTDIKFKGVIQLLKESWQIYRSRIGVIILIVTIPFVFRLLSEALINYLRKPPLTYSVWFSFFWEAISLISIFLSWLAIPVLIYSIKDQIGIKESYKKGLKIFWRFLWVFILLNSIIIGGFLLFIIPGFVFMVWFSLAIYTLISEEKGGPNALFRSKNLVAGKSWGVFWRFLALILIFTIISIIIATIVFSISFLLKMSEQQIDQLSQAYSYFVVLFFSPLFLIYGYLIYKNLTNIKESIPYQEPSAGTKLKYFLPGILGLLIFGLIMGFIFAFPFLSEDEPPHDDSDLRLSRIEIPREENTFYPFEKAGERMDWPHKEKDMQDVLEGEDWDTEFVEEILEKNEEAFYSFDEAANRSKFQIPDFQNPEQFKWDTSLPLMSGWRDVAKLSSIKSLYFFQQGKEKEAFDEAIKIVKIGHMIENSPRPILIQYLVGMAIKGIGLERIRTITAETTLPSELFKNYINQLEEFKTSKEGLINALKMEYMGQSTIIDELATDKYDINSLISIMGGGIEETPPKGRIIRSSYYFKPNQTKRLFAESYRLMFEGRFQELESQIRKESVAIMPPLGFIFPNSIGKVIYSMVAVSLEGAFERESTESFSTAGTQLLLALKGYKMENGNLPNNLSELVPEYFSEVPKDPSDGKPIRYLPEKKIIYSVGQDLKDSGGSEGKYLNDMPDPTLKIEF